MLKTCRFSDKKLTISPGFNEFPSSRGFQADTGSLLSISTASDPQQSSLLATLGWRMRFLAFSQSHGMTGRRETPCVNMSARSWSMRFDKSRPVVVRMKASIDLHGGPAADRYKAKGLGDHASIAEGDGWLHAQPEIA
jgi:hypothetical protein